MKKVLFFLLAIIFAIQGYGQSTFVVANGTATNSYLPVYGTWMDENQHNQFIYPASLLGPLPNATISKLTFHANSVSSAWGTATCIIKIGVPTETNFASATYNTTTLTQVYSGPIAVANSVLEFVLTTPYLFSGGNLLIDITTTTSGSFLGVSFNGITTSNGGVNQYGTGSPTLQQFIPKMSVEFTGGTPLVETSAATSVFATSAIFNGNFFAITPVTAGFQYMDATLTDWASATVVNATTLTAPMTETVSALTPNTQYKYRAFANNGTTFYYGEEKTFTTLALPAYLPYACDFENPTENAEWTLINGTQTNKFYIGDASYNPAINNTVGGSNALYISNDTGATWAYSAGSGNNSWVYAYRDFEVPAGVNELKLDFDWIANGGVATSEFLRVYWMPTSIPITAGAIPPTINSVNYDLTAMIGNYPGGYGQHWLSRQTTWQHATFTINTTQFPNLAGATWRLYVHWRNNQSTAVQPPATFDNMTLVVSNCPTPIIDSINNIAQNSVDIHFTENGSTNAWNFQYRILGTNTWSLAQATMNPFTLSGLQPSTSYEVRMQSDCSFEQSAWTPIKKFNTACGTITQIPWADYFDNYGTGTTIFPACWTRKANVADRPYISSTNFSSPGSMYFNCASSGIYNNASTPMIDAAYPINTLMLNFRSYFSGSDDTLYVGTMTDPIDSTTFTEIAKFSSTATATWINQVLYLNSYTGTDQYITFRTKYGASSSTIYIDNLQILPMPTCLIPNTLSSSNITAFDATINWLPGDISQSTWWIYYKPVASTTWDSVQVFAYPHTLTNLIPSTNYQFYMRTDCGSELSAATNVRTFMTQCVPVSTLPWNEGFEGLTAATTLPPCWAATSFGSKTNTQIVNYGSSNRNARTGTAAAYFVYSCNDRFFTPGMQLTAGVAYKFSYWFVTDGIAGWTTLQSGVYAAQTAGSLIQTMNTINGPTNGTYQEVVSYFTPTTDGVYYFGIYCQAAFAPNYLTIDDISLDLAPACLPVQQLAVSNIVGTSAYVSWFPAGTPDSYTVELSETGSGVWSTFSTTTPNFVLTNLTELTDYSVQVYPMCSGVEGPRDTVDFTTVCAAGGDLIIGTPTATTSTNGNYIPTQTYYNYSYTQQIFDASEIVTIDTINTISFQYFLGTTLSRNLTIYLGHTAQSTFTSTSNYIPIDSLTQVYQGTVSLNNSGIDNWLTISFPIGFVYDGVSNLVLAVRDMTGTYSNSNEKFRTHSVTGNKSVYYYMDTQAIDPNNPTLDPTGYSLTLNVINFRNNVKFSLPCETVSCYAPNVILSDVTNNSAEMIIVPGASETSWEGEYKAASDPTWTTLGTNVTSPFLLPALNSNTTYSVRFRTVCSASDVSTWKSVTFTTDCGTIETLPFVENFDSYTANSSNIPTCWTKLTTNGSYPYIYGYNSSSTPNSLYFYTSATTYAMIVLPPVDQTIPLNTLQLTFWGRNYSAGQNVKVGVMTNPNDAATFSLIGTFTPATASTYEEYIVSFANYTDTGVYIAIKSDNIAQSLSNEFYIDNLSLDLIPSCSKPLDIVFSTITTTEATASWDASPTALSYEVVYGLPGVDPTTATPISVTDTFYVMTPLTATTLYHFYVRSVCAGGEFSEWTSLRTFSTVALAPVPYSEPFATAVTPVGYNLTNFNVGSDYNNYVPGNPASNIYVNLYSGIPTANFRTINIGPLLPNYQLAFEYKLAQYTGGGVVPAGSGNFIVAISTDWGDTYTNVDTVDNNGIAGYQTYSFDLSAYDTQIIKIKITGNRISEDYYLGIDNIYVGPAITCPTPSALVTSNPSTTSIDLGWTENGTATEWQIEYGPVGFTQGLGTFLSATTNPSLTIPLLTPSTSYDFYVRSICGVGDTSMWSTKIVGTTLCLPTTLPFTEDFVSTSFPICWSQTYSGALTSNRWSVGSDNEAGGTGNEMVCSWQQAIGISRLITPGIDFGTNTSATLSFKHFYSDFDPGVTLKIQSSTDLTTWTDQPYSIIGGTGDVGPETATLTLTIPTGVNYIAFVVDGNHFSIDYWYIDDVTITSSTPVCAIPTNLAVNGVTSSTGTATWTAGGSETQWEIAYKATAASTWNYAFVNTPPPTYIIPALTAGIDYEVKVRAICAAGDTSAYSATANFTTSTVSCNTPTNLVAGTITNTGATITWTAGGTETSWEVEYKLAPATTWTQATTTTPTLALTGLSTCSDYNVRVRAVCGVGIFSSYTTVVNFSTLSPVPTWLAVSNITDQSALASWTANGPATSWQVEYKLVSSVNWTSGTANTTSFPMTGLQSNANYEVRVKALCSPNESAFTTPVPFTTLGGQVTYTITATAGANGTITPSGAVTVNQGASQTFNFAPSTGYIVSVVTVNGSPLTGAPTSYTFTDVQADGTIHVDFISGISENELAQLVELFPNPTSSTIELRLKSEDLHVKECKIYDMYGKLMKTIQINAETTSIDVTDFASGVYFVRMDSERGTISKKFVKK